MAEPVPEPFSPAGRDGAGSCFATTHWSAVLDAQRYDGAAAAAALETLCRTYYYPLYAFVRRHGHQPADAEDLTQEFFSRFVARDYLASVNPQKGRFRSFLLACLKHFLSVARTREGAMKRGGRQTFVPLDDPGVEGRYLAEPPSERPVEVIFDCGWATTLMEQALAGVRTEFEREGKREQFDRLHPFLSREPVDGEYAALAAAAQTTTGAIGVAVHRLRQRYGQLVRAEVANTVAQPADVEDELRYLFATLTAPPS